MRNKRKQKENAIAVVGKATPSEGHERRGGVYAPVLSHDHPQAE
jgi:hypothetical protein